MHIVTHAYDCIIKHECKLVNNIRHRRLSMAQLIKLILNFAIAQFMRIAIRFTINYNIYNLIARGRKSWFYLV